MLKYDKSPLYVESGIVDMNARQTKSATLMAVIVGLAANAHALTFDEFDRLPQHHQENFIFTVLNFYHYQFTRDDRMIGVANCMVELDERTAADGRPHLYSEVVRSLDSARLASGNGSTIEGVIRDVVDRECPPR